MNPDTLRRFQVAENLVRRQAELERPVTFTCRRCGTLEPDEGTPGNWLAVAAMAQAHADTAGRGHWVAATFWQGGIFRPGKDKEAPGDQQ